MTTVKKNKHAVALGRLGGRSTSEKKKAAVRLNGKLGGRPKKLRQGDWTEADNVVQWEAERRQAEVEVASEPDQRLPDAGRTGAAAEGQLQDRAAVDAGFEQSLADAFDPAGRA